MMSKAEEYLKKSIRKCQEGDRPYNEWVSTDCAKLAIEIASEEMIQWIEDNIEQYPIDNWDRFVNSLITDLKQAIKDE